MDEAADCSDLVIAPTTTGPASNVKTFETTKTLGALDILYPILLTRIIPNTLGLKQSIDELEERHASCFDIQVTSLEALKSFFGNAFDDDFYGYEAVYEQLKKSIKEDREILRRRLRSLPAASCPLEKRARLSWAPRTRAARAIPRPARKTAALSSGLLMDRNRRQVPMRRITILPFQGSSSKGLR